MSKKTPDDKILIAYTAYADKQGESAITICTEALEQCTK